MRIGTIAVREKLPDNAKHLTDKQIQESLWHYYYDIDKSVAYLASTVEVKEKKVEVKKKEIAPGELFSFCWRYTGLCMRCGIPGTKKVEGGFSVS